MWPFFWVALLCPHPKRARKTATITTSVLITKINTTAQLEPPIKANTPRISVAALALLAKSPNGSFLIRDTAIEAALGWKRGSEMLIEYTKHSMDFMPGSFPKALQTLRNNAYLASSSK